MCEKCNCGGCKENPTTINLSIKDITSKFAETMVFDCKSSFPNNMETILNKLFDELVFFYGCNFFIEYDCDKLFKTVCYCLADLKEFKELDKTNSSLRYNNLFISEYQKLNYKYTDYLILSFVSNAFNDDVLI